MLRVDLTVDRGANAPSRRDRDGGDIEDLLTSLEGVGVRGLPVGPDASAVLANAVLAPVDRALREAGIDHLRWVDDVVLSGPDPEAAVSTLREALGRIDLRLNERKTRIVLDPASLRTGSPVSAWGRR